jgi:hypothetical protein
VGQSITGAWSRSRQGNVPYATARVWGTGINPVHAVRSDTGRPYNAKLNANQLDQVPAEFAIAQAFIEHGPDWGYTQDDIAGLDVFTPQAVSGIRFTDEGWPAWEGTGQQGKSTPVNRAWIPRYTSRPLGMSRGFYNWLRSIRGGAYDTDRWVSNQVPTETVSEGWINKAASGMEMGEVPDDMVMPSAVAQYERQTSMQQRHMTMNNDRAVERCADDPRTSIPSRVAPMKLKVYSGEERHYDMFPYQADVIPRPFTIRTAGTGPQPYLKSNDQHVRIALQRTPPPDFSMGTPDLEIDSGSQFGYTSEESGYY